MANAPAATPDGSAEAGGYQATRIFVRPLGTPLPLGFLALAVATVSLAGLQLGWVPASESHQVGIVLVAFAFPLQSLAAVFGYLSRDTVGGTGVGVLSGTWLTSGLLLLTSMPGSRSHLLGIFLFMAGAALLVPVVGATGKLVAGAVLLVASARFVVTGVYEVHGGLGWEHAAGWVGIALGALAVYAAAAFELESVRHHAVLPVVRTGLGRRAMTAGFRGQLRRIEREPGVREQL